jgi:Flp pilus assembly pilin Flp
MFRFRQFRARTRAQLGQTFVEYALILAAVSAGVLLTLTWTGLATAVQAALDTVIGAF